MKTRQQIVAGLAATAIAAFGVIAAQGEEPGDVETSLPTIATAPAAPVKEGDPREKGDRPITTPDAGKRAGAPVATARAFVAEWVNRTADATELRRQRPILVGLSAGEFAQLVQLTIDDTLTSRRFGLENQGSVVVARSVEAGEKTEVLIVTRERQVENGRGLEPYRYVTYIARLERVSGGYAVSALGPQA